MHYLVNHFLFPQGGEEAELSTCYCLKDFAFPPTPLEGNRVFPEHLHGAMHPHFQTPVDIDPALVLSHN